MKLNFKPTKPDPRVLILQIICASILSFSFTNWLAAILLFVMTAIVAAALQSWRKGARACAVYALFLFLLWLLQRLTIPVISDIFSMFFLLLVRIYPVYLLCGLLVYRAPMNELLTALSHWHIPQAVLIPLAVIYRYIPTTTREITYVNESLKMRGVNASIFSLVHHPIKTAERFLVPLLYRSERITEELSAASLCKGLTIHRQRTCLSPTRLGWQDVLYTVGIAVTTIALLCINHEMR